MIAFTITSLAYLPHARVLARSYARHHPGNRLWVLMIDDVQNTVIEQQEPFNILRVDDLPLDRAELHRMALLFGGKLIATIKPWVFRYFLSEGADTALYIDGDFVIYGSLDGMADPNEGVVLVPHVLSPLPRDGKDPDETSLLGSGMYNAGMFGVGRQNGGFLEFLAERLQRECLFDPRKMRFNEQRWLDFVPVLFPHRIIRDPGIDVAYWNLQERPLSRKGEQWFAGDAPLRAFHFSSFDPRGHHAGGRYEWTGHPRIRLAENPLFAALCDEYGSALYSEGFAESVDRPFAFEMLPDGSPVYESLRVLFRRAVLKADAGHGAYPPDPFDRSRRGEFEGWAAEQYEQARVSVPRRLSTAASARHPVAAEARVSIGSRIRGWVGTRRTRDELTGPQNLRRSRWAVDLLDRMIMADAGERRATAIEILPERAGFVCHGPRIPLGAGFYSVTLEFDGQPVGAGVSAFDQALVIEAFVEGYAVGSKAVTFGDLSDGTLVLDVHIPEGFVRESVLYGLEMRLLTRGRLHARLSAIVLESIDTVFDAVGSASTHYEWLPVMAGGEAGRRAGVEVAAAPGATGVIVSGPNWRLMSGRYRAAVQLRKSGGEADDGASTNGQAVTVEVVANDRVLDTRSLPVLDIQPGPVELRFDVDDRDSGPDVGIGIRIRNLLPVDLVVSSVDVDRIVQLSEARESVA